MPFPVPNQWNRDTAEFQRDEEKREKSPCSFFYSQGKALVLAGNYFTDSRLSTGTYRGTAAKHRHRIRLAIFGQLMAAFEYMLKDFFAKAIDITSVFDDRLKKEGWISVTIDDVVAQRSSETTVGGLLIHPTGGWHNAEAINSRTRAFFGCEIVDPGEYQTLERLWVIRHSVAHNAGWVTSVDAGRIGIPQMGGKTVEVDGQFLEDTFDFLCPIASRLAHGAGKCVLSKWLKSLHIQGPDFSRDESDYQLVKWLGLFERSRPRSLATFTERDYRSDWARYGT